MTKWAWNRGLIWVLSIHSDQSQSSKTLTASKAKLNKQFIEMRAKSSFLELTTTIESSNLIKMSTLTQPVLRILNTTRLALSQLVTEIPCSKIKMFHKGASLAKNSGLLQVVKHHWQKILGVKSRIVVLDRMISTKSLSNSRKASCRLYNTNSREAFSEEHIPHTLRTCSTKMVY